LNRTLVLTESFVELYCDNVRSVISGDSAKSNRTEARSAMNAPDGRLTSLRLNCASVENRFVGRRPTVPLTSVRCPSKKVWGE